MKMMTWSLVSETYYSYLELLILFYMPTGDMEAEEEEEDEEEENETEVRLFFFIIIVPCVII